jgi:hypothetical protein
VPTGREARKIFWLCTLKFVTMTPMTFCGIALSAPAKAWSLVTLWSLAIFLTIPFARTIQNAFDRVLGSHLYLAASGLAGLFFLIIVLIYIFRRRKTRILRRLAWLLKHQLQTPAEAIHFFQYGILSFFLFQAWRHRIQDRLIYPIVVMSVVIVASVDEFFQWAMPGRHWDFRDIRLNLMAGLIVQLFIALVIHPSAILPLPARRSVRWLCRITWLTLLLLGIAVSNTPARVDLYATRIPFLRFLSNNESVMSEYGYRHEDPEIGVFYSRFTVPELLALDHERGAETGAILLRYQAFIDYREFIQIFTASVDPFLHEMRVHLHRRDHYASVSSQYRDDDPARFVHHMTVALRENQILEKYFARALAASGNRWPEHTRAEIVSHADPSLPYSSAVSDHLITAATEAELWLVLGTIALLMGFVYHRYGRRLS